MRKKICVFTGAGISQESGISTFRDVKDGLWYNYKVEEVATIEGWMKDQSKVLGFYNERRKSLDEVKPNDAHIALAELEQHFEVTIITQNVDDLHERAGSTSVLHLHGELLKMRSVNNETKLLDCTEDIKVGDCAEDGSQLRPHLVLFGEFPYNVIQAEKALKECDYLLIVGTSLSISYTVPMLHDVNRIAELYYIDPNPYPFKIKRRKTNFIRKSATIGVREIAEKLITDKRNTP